MRPAVLTLCILNRIDALPPCMDKAETFLAAHGVAAEDGVQVMVMLDEIASNIIKAAWPSEEEHRFEVTLTIGPDGLLTLVSIDDGVSFDPTGRDPPDLEAALEDRDIGGLGLFLVGEMSDSMDYSRVDGRNRLSVTMRVGGPV